MPAAKHKITVQLCDVHTDFYVRKSLDQERVLQLILLYEANTDVLPITIAPWHLSAIEGRHQYVLVDGRHRFTALQHLGRKETTAYVIEGDDVDLIAAGFTANYGGSKPPTEGDIIHTIELLMGKGLRERQIMDRLPMPRPVTRKYVQVAGKNILQRAVKAAASDVLDKGMTVTAAAEAHDVETAQVREFMGAKTKKRSGRLDSFKGPLTQRYRSFAMKNSSTLRRLLQGYEDGEVSEKTVLSVLAHLFNMARQHKHTIEDYANRFEAIRKERKGESRPQPAADSEQRASA